MQGLWTNHRRNKVNLNTTLPSTPPIVVFEEASTASGRDESNVGDTVTPADDVNTPDASAISLTSPLQSSKRRTRPVRHADGVDERSSKRMKTRTIAKDHIPPSTRLSDLGGIQPCVEKMLELVAMPLSHPEVYLHTGIQPPRGVLLHGPPGCGKTLLANAIAGVSSFTS